MFIAEVIIRFLRLYISPQFQALRSTHHSVNHLPPPVDEVILCIFTE